MRIRTAVFGLFLIGLWSCSNDDFDITSFQDDSSIKTLNGTWKVISFEDYAANKVELKSQENSRGYDIVVTFDDTKDPNELSGQNTTNTIFGTFEYLQVRQFRVHDLGATEVAQPRWADEFIKAILDGNIAFKINARRLRIYYDNEQKSMTLTKQ